MISEKQDLTKYGDNELSLVIFNCEMLYRDIHRRHFIASLDDLFIYTDKQLEVLKQDIEQDYEEIHNDA